MYCQLGNIVFENLKTFGSYSRSGSVTYPEHSLIDAKPRLQRTGSGLDEITLSIRFHVSFCNPGDELDALTRARDEGEVLSLLWGNGTLAGNFVITTMSHEIEDADAQGNVFSYSVNLTLKEFVTPDKLLQLEHESRNKAKAVGDKKPVAKKKNNPLTCPQIVTRIVNSIENHAMQINTVVLQRGGANTIENKNKIKGHLTAIGKFCADLIQRNSDPKSCVVAYPSISQRTEALKSETEVFQIEISANPARVPNANSLLQMKVKNLKSAARPLVNQAITRK